MEKSLLLESNVYGRTWAITMEKQGVLGHADIVRIHVLPKDVFALYRTVSLPHMDVYPYQQVRTRLRTKPYPNVPLK